MTEAPRWRLTEAHYLNVPGTEWEQKEMNQTTRKQVTKRYPVPTLLDPKQPTDWNYPDEIIVAHAGVTNMPRDIIFEGPPTLSMEPLNEAAEKLLAPIMAKSQHPIDSLPAQGDPGFTEHLLAKFGQQLQEAINKAGGIPTPVPNTAIPADAVAQLQAQMNALMEKNAELERRIAQAEHADDPLPHVEITEEEEQKSNLGELTPSMSALGAHAKAAARRL